MLLLVVVSALWFNDNADFVRTAEQQIKEGYEWNYVGKTPASGVPAITIKTQNEEYVLFKLKK
jgi:hypothetical protein